METIEYAELVPDPEENGGYPVAERKSFVEQLLSPIMLQRMMACGGALLVLGFVGWLWSTGIFQQPHVAATTIGIVTLSVMGLGIAIVRRSRYQLAGTGLTLLAALALPLNLWFYDAQGLITLSDGGHLWIPAAFCCAIYAYIARTLRNPMFVYTLVAGVVMTGLLFLADQSVNCFWQLMPPVSFLLAVGWMSFFADRLFAEEVGDFSRKRFGYAFRLSGVAVMVGGFILLAAGQLSGRFAEFLPLADLPLITTDRVQKLWAIGLLLGSGCGFSADRLIGNGSRTSTLAAMGVFAWAGLSVLDYFAIQLQLPHFAIAAGVYSMITWRFAVDQKPDDGADRHRVGADIVLPFVALPFVGILQYVAQFVVTGDHPLFSTDGLLVAIQMFVTAAVGYVGWRKVVGVKNSALSYLLLSSVFAVLGTFSVAFHFDVASLDLVAASAFSVPMFCIVVGLLFSRPENTPDWQDAALTSLWFIVFSVLAISTELPARNLHGSTCWISAVAAAVMFAASYGRRTFITSRLSYLVLAFSISQLLCLWGLSTDYSLVLSATVMGTVLAIVGVAFRQGVDRVEDTGAVDGSRFEEPANLLVFVGAVSGVLLALNRLLATEATLGLLAVLLCQLSAVVVVGLLARKSIWRMMFRAVGIANVMAGILVVNSSLEAHWLQRAELGAILFGVALLVIGHIGWYREGETEDGAATAVLWSGSLLVAVPMACGLLFYRSHEVVSIWNWWFFHEAASIVAAMLLLGMGMACKIRSTAIGGVSLSTVYLASLLALVQWPGQLKNVSVLMMIGGGVFFLVAVLLSIYRDRLLSLPEDIRAGRGMFRVLRWR